MMTWTLYQCDNVFSDFIGECDEDLKKAIRRRAFQLGELGNEAREPISKPLKNEDGLFELRANTDRHQVRFIYCFLPGRKIVFLESSYKKDALPEAVKVRAREKKKALIEEGVASNVFRI